MKQFGPAMPARRHATLLWPMLSFWGACQGSLTCCLAFLSPFRQGLALPVWRPDAVLPCRRLQACAREEAPLARWLTVIACLCSQLDLRALRLACPAEFVERFTSCRFPNRRAIRTRFPSLLHVLALLICLPLACLQACGRLQQPAAHHGRCRPVHPPAHGRCGTRAYGAGTAPRASRVSCMLH